MNYQYQIGGGKCSLCGSPNTNSTTCPLNPKAVHPNPMKHPLAVGRSVAQQKVNTSNVPIAVTAIQQPTTIRKAIQQPTTIRKAIQQPTTLSKVIQQPTTLRKVIQQPTTIGPAIQQVSETPKIKISQVKGPESLESPERLETKPKVEMQYIDTPPFGCVLGRIGRRATMEDEHVTVIFDNGINLYGVFDGHGGAATAIFLRENLPKELYKALITSGINLNDKDAVEKAIMDAYANIDAQIFKKGDDSGSTAIVILQIHDTLYFINLGDSRAILVQEGKVIHATIDQKPIDELDRIKAAGGFVMFGRVGGSLAVARAFGDKTLKVDENGKYMGPNAPVSSVPVITTFDMKPNTTYIALLACDGLWDVMTNEEAAEQLPPVGQLTAVCNKLVDEAYNKGSQDNISAMVTVFKAE